MIYPQSKKIWQKISKAKKIIVNIHPNADYDAVGSALALKRVLKQKNKKVLVVSPKIISQDFSFMVGFDNIKMINFSNFDFSLFDLFIILDSSSSDRITGSKEINLFKNINYLVFDHHQSNNLSYLGIIDKNASATAEILVGFFSDLRIKIDKITANLLLAGILGDTVFLRYTKDRIRTMTVVKELIEKGADMDFLSSQFFERYELKSIKLLGLFLTRLKKEKGKKSNFIWSAVSYDEYCVYGQPSGVREMAADLFFRGIKEMDFGVAILEEEKNKYLLSFRSKAKFDVSVIAKKLGGGGHKNAAGATIIAQDYKRIINKLKKLV